MTTLCSGVLIRSSLPWTRNTGGVSFGTFRPGDNSSLSLCFKYPEYAAMAKFGRQLSLSISSCGS